MSDLIAVMVQCVIEKPVTPDSTESEGEGEEPPPTKKVKCVTTDDFSFKVCVDVHLSNIYAWGGKHACAKCVYICICAHV